MPRCDLCRCKRTLLFSCKYCECNLCERHVGIEAHACACAAAKVQEERAKLADRLTRGATDDQRVTRI